MRHRLFVAAYPAIEWSRNAIDAIRRMDLPPHRTVEPAAVHLTLRFIGDVIPKDLDAVIESVHRSAAGIGPFRMTPERLITLPSRGDARLIACRTDSPAGVLEIHRRLATRLARSLRRSQADRFLPHLTLARFNSPSPGFRVDEPVELEPITVDTIRLVETEFKTDRVVHREIDRVTLETAGRSARRHQ